MIQAGILGEDDNVELLEGWIVPKMARNPAHDAMISMIMIDVLPPRLPKGWFCRGQSAITTTDSEPEPDIAVVRGTPRDYLARHPGPADMVLVIEVAESSLPRDRSHKGRIYAAASVPVYWIINLVDPQVEVYTDPTGPDACAGLSRAPGLPSRRPGPVCRGRTRPRADPRAGAASLIRIARSRGRRHERESIELRGREASRLPAELRGREIRCHGAGRLWS